MEALGRTIAIALSAVGLVVLFLFYKTASVRWQKAETVRSLCHVYVDGIMDDRMISCADWEQFRKELNKLGNYRTELAVYERRRFEGENGRIYMFTEWEEITENMLPQGSYIRLVVTEGNGKPTTFIYGPGITVFAGGRIN